MPKTSKIRSPNNSRPSKSDNTKSDKFCCTRCGKLFATQSRNFLASKSSLYKNNGGYLPVCGHCVDELFEHYRDALGSEVDAIRRICMKFDIYWNIEIYNALPKLNTSNSRIRSYISRTNLRQYSEGGDKTYDDTLDEEYEEELKRPKVIRNIEDADEPEDIELDPKIVEFWGTGFEPSFYLELDRKYKYWTDGLKQEDLDIGAEALYKQVCILETTINRDSAAGKPIEKNVNALNSLLGSLNAKPSQKRTDESDSVFDSMSFGVGIRVFENTKPIPKPDPQLQDVDGIVKYITVWFLGHLCKMLHIKNTYSKMYEDELERLRVEIPELAESEDDESLFNDIFGGDD